MVGKFAARPFVYYGELLERYPYSTKSFTSGIMYAAGDLLAQSGENYHKQMQQQQHSVVCTKGECDSANTSSSSMAAAAAATTTTATTTTTTTATTEAKDAAQTNDQHTAPSSLLEVLDGKRAGVFFLFGLVVSGPVMSLWFGFLNELPSTLWRLRQARQSNEILKAYFLLKHYGIDVKLDLAKVPKAAKLSKFYAKAVKILADQLVFSSLYTLIFFLSIGMMNGAVKMYEQKQVRGGGGGKRGERDYLKITAATTAARLAKYTPHRKSLTH